MNQSPEDKVIMKKTLLYAFVILVFFFVVSKILSRISTKPAQQSYEKHCGSCHGLQGEGLKDLIPPLAGSDWLAKNQENLVCAIRYGIKGEIQVNGKTYEQTMDGVKLNDIQLYNIINYINTSWGNQLPLTSTESVLDDLKECSNK